MHEMSLAEGIVDIALSTAHQNSSSRILGIEVAVGDFAGVEREALAFCFDAVIKGTIAEGATLQLQAIPLTARCLDCNLVFAPLNYAFKCTYCGSTTVVVESGRELKVVSVDLD